MRAIELLGPSGVGKTFLYQRVSDIHAKRRYLNVAEACVKAASELKVKVGLTSHYLYSVLLKSGLLPSKKYGLSRRLLFGQGTSKNDEQAYQLSLELLTQYLAKEENQEVVAKRIANFSNCMELNLVLEDHLSKEQLVFFDEGALHHHHGLSRAVVAQYSLEKIKTDSALNPNAVIFCQLPFEQHMSRIEQRKKEGVNTFSHKKLSGTQLEDYVKNNVAEYKEKVETLSMFDIPILYVDTGQDVTDNLNQIDAFINSLT